MRGWKVRDQTDPLVRTDGAIRRLNVGNNIAATGVSSDQLSQVLGYFARSLGADGWALIAAGAEREPASAAIWGGSVEPHMDVLVRAVDRVGFDLLGHPPTAVWLDGVDLHGGCETLLITVGSDERRPPFYVSLVFNPLGDDRRHAIEQTCGELWTFASAYLRLWQSVRVHSGRITGLEGALNSVAIGVILLAKDAHIVFANRAATAMIQRRDGVREHRGRLQAVNRDDSVALDAALAHLLAEQPGSTARERAPLLTFRCLEGVPIVASLGGVANGGGVDESASAMLLLVDPKMDIRQLAEPVCKLYRLSRVETELVCLIVSGMTLKDAAQALRIKLDTARGYLKHVFIKTGMNRQVDLVRLIFSNVACA